ncbi:6917_t:CDS:2 [Ambispora leptoticha]|uniref:6917_t:CDS:1 n=1 Tax=Ambispora leptoticha TaxID=144679 RepID=A0A9N9NGS8_9GLOM|nr:6917_t:CDS:2 [Ambispora leptoticha]
MSHSRRYREIKEKIADNKHYNLAEAVDFLRNNNPERLKNIKAIKNERKVAVIKEGLPEDILKECQNIKEVELLTVAEVRQKPLQKLLGPKGLYPTKKNGSLTENILEEIKKFQQGEIEVKTDKGGNIHAVIGSCDFSSKQLEENYKIMYDKITELKPTGWKGDFLKNITLSTTMGPGLKILK